MINLTIPNFFIIWSFVEFMRTLPPGQMLKCGNGSMADVRKYEEKLPVSDSV